MSWEGEVGEVLKGDLAEGDGHDMIGGELEGGHVR